MTPFMKRSSTYDQLNRMYELQPSGSDQDRRKDRFQLYMIFASGAAQLSSTASQYHKPISYYATAMEDADILTEFPGLTQIQNNHLIMLFASLHPVGSELHSLLSTTFC